MTTATATDPLVLGPLLRYVDESSATIWVRTADPALVTVERAGHVWSAPTFAVHGSHFALVVLDGLEPGSDDAYEVRLDGTPVWPREDAAEPGSHAGADPRTATRLRHLPHDREPRRGGQPGPRGRCAALLRDCPEGRPRRRTGPTCSSSSATRSTRTPRRTPSLEEFMAARRDLSLPPGDEIKDFVEYAEPVPARVERRRRALGAVDGALGDDVRRPRHPRRLEHVVVVAARDPPRRGGRSASSPGSGPTGCTSTSATSRRPSLADGRCGAT